jgi:hypothetical protein
MRRIQHNLMLKREPSMRYMRGLAILAMLLSSTLLAAKGTQTIYLATPVRAGNAELPRGICEVSSIAPTGSRVRLQESVLHSLHIAIPSQIPVQWALMQTARLVG